MCTHRNRLKGEGPWAVLPIGGLEAAHLSLSGYISGPTFVMRGTLNHVVKLVQLLWTRSLLSSTDV